MNKYPDGTLLSIKTLRTGQTEDVTDLADLKLLIGSTRAVTVRSGTLVAVEELRQHLLSDRTLVTAVDLLGFLVSAMTNRMEAVIYELTQDIDDVEDALLDGGIRCQPRNAERASAPNLSHPTASEWHATGACSDDDRSHPGPGRR